MNIVLTFYGYKFSIEVREKRLNIVRDMREFPKVSIMIPAHNESKVIEKTLLSMVNLNYPNDAYEVIVINDNSSDDTGRVIERVMSRYPTTKIIHIETDAITGGKGKSNALNIGYKQSSGDFLAIYDADNTVNNMALRYLVYEILSNDKFGAVIGMFRTRNKEKNWLTQFINIETLSFQWMAQAGRWKLLKLCTIPGTNFIIRRSIIETIGGWDPKAIAEDTEISFRIYQLGYKIAFTPLARTFEQEPETVKVWIKQRTRWVSGNIYVLSKFVKEGIKNRNTQIFFDLFYFFSVYIFFLSSILVSDAIFIIGMVTDYRITVTGNFIMIWVMSYFVFILQIAIALSIEKGESNFKNIRLLFIMYFTYCQMWLLVAIKGVYSYLKTNVMKLETKWYKTERF
jgi:cellulose synthase/poly-beta-1,6-N-acetylglucosamine synthase-like glycosyltransferase